MNPTIPFLLLALLLVGGCGTYSSPQYFDDTGNDVENMKVCHSLAKESCDSNVGCSSYRITTLICDGEKCFCD